MGGQSMLELSPLHDPTGRRRWLLVKALENTPFAEALALAQAAEDFLAGRAQRTAERAPEPARRTAATPKLPDEKRFGVLDGLSSLVSLDEVVRYLRQCDENIDVDTGNAEELLARANLKRTDQGLPLFALLPGIPAQAKQQDKPERVKKVALPRPASARERAEWARHVISLPEARAPADGKNR
jgi:hypothetical protein